MNVSFKFMKKTYTLLKQSFLSILNNKGRSFLTILGIVIGIASVIALISLGEGVNRMVTKQIEQLGTTTVVVMPGGGFGGEGSGPFSQEGAQSGQYEPGAVSSLTLVDLESLNNRETHPEIEVAAGAITTPSIIRSPYLEKRVAVHGTSPSFLDINNNFVLIFFCCSDTNS